MVFKYQQLCSRRTGLPVNRFSKKICKMKSPVKDKETETNRDLLRSTVQKLPILRKNPTQNRNLQIKAQKSRVWQAHVRRCAQPFAYHELLLYFPTNEDLLA
jgi:hypothetical protein